MVICYMIGGERERGECEWDVIMGYLWMKRNMCGLDVLGLGMGDLVKGLDKVLVCFECELLGFVVCICMYFLLVLYF